MGESIIITKNYKLKMIEHNRSPNSLSLFVNKYAPSSQVNSQIDVDSDIIIQKSFDRVEITESVANEYRQIRELDTLSWDKTNLKSLLNGKSEEFEMKQNQENKISILCKPFTLFKKATNQTK